MHIPLDSKIKELVDVPYTLSFIIRKRLQVDSLMELPKEKRPDDFLIYEGTPEELETFLDRVLSGKEQQYFDIAFSEDEIE